MASEPEETGVEVREITRAEAWALLDEDCRRRLGVGVEEFARRYHAGEYDDPDDDPDVMWLAMELESLERNQAAEPSTRFAVPAADSDPGGLDMSLLSAGADIEVREITRKQSWAALDEETRRYLGINAEEFARRYNTGEYDDPDDDPRIMRLGFHLEFLQQNSPAAP